jgi:hypothetical protein
MRAHLLWTLLFGLVAECFAIGCAYGVYRFFERVPLYALFYVPLHDDLIQPLFVRLRWSSRIPDYVSFAMLVVVNSLKWAGDILLLQRRRWISFAFVTALLLGAVFVSISLESIRL